MHVCITRLASWLARGSAGRESNLPILGSMAPVRYSPAADRNKQPILDTLRRVLPDRGKALEIASGTGQHVAWFAQNLPQWNWQPSDAYVDGFSDIALHTQGLHNVHGPRVLDVLKWPWLDDVDAKFDAIYCANMIHISPWATTKALMQGAGQILSLHGILITYGPYLERDVPTSEGNQQFDTSLRAQNPAWGIRRLEDVEKEAVEAGLRLAQRMTMPANNLLLVWTFSAAV